MITPSEWLRNIKIIISLFWELIDSFSLKINFPSPIYRYDLSFRIKFSNWLWKKLSKVSKCIWTIPLLRKRCDLSFEETWISFTKEYFWFHQNLASGLEKKYFFSKGRQYIYTVSILSAWSVIWKNFNFFHSRTLYAECGWIVPVVLEKMKIYVKRQTEIRTDGRWKTDDQKGALALSAQVS